MTPKNSNLALIFVALTLAAAIGVLGYLTRGDGIPAPLATTANSFAAATSTGLDTSSWQTYSSGNFGFSLRYPTGWEISEGDLGASVPYITLGNPIEGARTYAIKIWIVKVKDGTSAEDYVKSFLKADAAMDAANAKKGPAPQITPKFNNQYAVAAGSYQGYELFNVFEFDHSAEQIYVANGGEILVFDFPIASDNANIASPVENNALAHQIVNTLQLAATGQTGQ